MSRSIRTLALVLLALGSSLLTTAHVLGKKGVREIGELRETVARSGGGVVFIRNPEDCSALAGPVEQLALRLRDAGTSVYGRVIRGTGIRDALEIANRAFPHEAISPRATGALHQMGHVSTPMALVIDRFGKVTTIKTVDGRSVASMARALISRIDDEA